MASTSQPMPGPSPTFDTEPTNTPDQFSFENATFNEVLEDVSSRFILNLPEGELSEIERVCFQVEQAHWYYEDFIRDHNAALPSLPLKKFSEILFRSCPLLHHWSHDHETAFNGFMNYKTRVPVCGAIMLNEALTKCVLVKGWKSSAGWGFPKGKVNENEDEALCAVREVAEETGYNLSGQIRETDCIKLYVKQQPITLFVVPDVPEDFPFKTQTRKEISKIDWFKLADLPTWKKNASGTSKFYLITPAIGPLKAIVRDLRKERKATKHLQQAPLVPQVSLREADDRLIVEESMTRVAAESPVTTGTSSRSQFGEGEVYSSQSSSIDPHTPSIHGDLGPRTSDDALIVKPEFSTHPQDITLDVEQEGVSADALLPGVDIDPRSHWSRLMTRLNNSEENSPRGTPQALTPTPSITSKPTKAEPLPGTTPHTTGTINRSMRMGPSIKEHPGVSLSQKTINQRPNVVARSSPASSPPCQLQPSGVGMTETGVGSASLSSTSPPAASSVDVLAKRTKQLQLLDSVLAEESTKGTLPLPPKSAHIFGAYPHTSTGLFPDQVRMPIRPASVNMGAPRTLNTPYHHQPNVSISTLAGVLPVPAPLHHQYTHPPQGHPPQLPLRGNGLSTLGRPPTSPSSQFPLTSYSATHLPPFDAHAIDAAHRGQMLSILSGEPSGLRFPNAGGGFRPGSAFHDTGALSPSSHRSFSSMSSMGAAPRSANAHLLSILNNPSTAGTGRISPAAASGRQ